MGNFKFLIAHPAMSRTEGTVKMPELLQLKAVKFLRYRVGPIHKYNDNKFHKSNENFA